MTRERWSLLLGEWCQILGIEKPPRLEFVPPRRMPRGVGMLTEFYLACEENWVIKINTGELDDPEAMLVHELMHVLSQCTDQIHEEWIRKSAAALINLHRGGRKC